MAIRSPVFFVCLVEICMIELHFVGGLDSVELVKRVEVCHALSEIEFGGDCPDNWYSDSPLSEWDGIKCHSAIVLMIV